jgi:GTPase SAR1 family protein
MVLYGQIVIGAPGSGKTTYCDGMQQYLRLLGRDCWVVNLDPANEVPPGSNNDGDEHEDGEQEQRSDDAQVEKATPNSQLPYETILDVCNDIISLDSVMTTLHLGPNGGLLYCMEYIEYNLGEVISLLKDRLGLTQNGLHSSKAYILFDLPGQIELTAHSGVVSRIAQRLVRELDLRLVCVQLVDAAICLPDVSKFIGASLVCTSSMMRMELPCVNVFSKMDLLSQSGITQQTKGGEDDGSDSDGNYGDSSPLPFNLEFFTQCHDLHRLIDYLDSNPLDFTNTYDEYFEDPEYQSARDRTRNSRFYKKYHKLHYELCDLVEDFGLLNFLPLSIQDAESVGRVVARIDKCNGYVFVRQHNQDNANNISGREKSNNLQDVFSSAIVADAEWGTGVLVDVQEKYMGNVMFREEISELKPHR